MNPEIRQPATTSGTGCTASAAAEERAVLAVFDSTSTAWSDGDADAFADRYGEDATVILPGARLRGREDIRSSMGDAFAGPLKGSRRVHTPQSVRFLGADVAIVVTRSATLSPGETSPAADRWELATWTLSRHDGRWLVQAYHSCFAG
ncbi:hypothetical protein Misp01_64880 [Microtetraspora sp. NBRC 13810]|uniref:SgcJ/EcaC family oxidoreductase n=1 Tax=Microtetraspora sp. NBRC 13810 TaxID=3030990 RepID=UPI0024A54E6F|nr:SgcJ/EcaC family oxidoreductase [Microtetraspora sp. NBRC 13810]GLW11360.1 hypothetical protein Misp01_64880 [Microtetraspora sp. NBRC 13810]